jgi:hypothetical protein
MSYASKAGRARTSAKSPRAFAVCDRCGIWYNRDQLINQNEWRGMHLQPLYIFVCKKCLDIPQENLRAIALPADPVPIWQPRVENFEQAENDYRSLAQQTIDPVTGIPIPSTTLRVTEDCENRITQPIGQPAGLEQAAIMPYNNAVMKPFGVPLKLLSVTANGTNIITATCSAAHGLATNGQISAAGLSNSQACGFFSVTVVNPIVFAYSTISAIPSGPLLTSTTRIVTALVGLPYGSRAIPPVGA